jgi:2-keto-4-pentenoate hydratase
VRNSGVPNPPLPLALANGMRAQLARRDAQLDGGATAVGWKIGFNAKAAQDHFGLRGPVVGYLTDATVIAAGDDIAISGWVRAALEVEVAIRVGEDGGVAALAPALELVDLDRPLDRIEPILAHNVFHRGVVFGPEVDQVDLTELTVTVESELTRLRASGQLTESPATTIDVVRSFLATYGSELAPGDRIIAGSLIAPLSVEPGDAVDVSFGPLGQLTARFT